MKTKFWFAAIFAILVFSLVLVSPAIGSILSTNREFNSTQDSIFLNYTNLYSQNITLWSNASYALTLNISNYSTSISANYSQPNTATACLQSNIGFLARNVSNNAISQIILPSLGSSSALNLTFSMLSCFSGRYWGSFNIMNSTNATENLTINAFIDVPISANNYPNLPTTGLANITGSMPGNANAFHRYYFNTSVVNRSTSITINLTAAQDMDIFLFDNSTAAVFLAKSINKSNSSEWLTFWPLTPNSMYEIRVFGNITNVSSTSYNFYTIFSTLNATYTSDFGKPASNISFGSLNTSMINIQNITLKNEGNFTMDSVTESKEIYYVKRWEINTSSATLFDGLFLVPSFATKIRIVVNWTNVTQNYSVYLTAPNKTVIDISNGKFLNANFTNASLEEYSETAGIVQGYWNASVRHNTNAGGSNYTLTAYVWYPVSDWIATNYSSMTFNISGNNNSMTNISVNFTASNNSIAGNYEGFLQYTTAQGAALRIPFTASVNTSTLVANNTIGSAAVQINENIGANLTKVLNITLNNTGSYPLSFALENSTSNSNALWSGNNYMNFTYQVPSSPLTAGANHLVNITFYLDPNTTRNTSGMYEGYIKFITNDSRPYQNFTLTLRVNLTNDLNVVLLQTLSIDGDANWINQTGVSETFTAPLNIYYINGTGSEITSLNTSNFSSVWLTNANISYRIPASGSLSIANGTNPIYSSSKYNLNVTVPASQPGGIYQLHIGANYSRGDGYVFKGEGVYNYLYINNTGLSMSTTSSTSISIANTSTSIFYANVSNFGPIPTSSATIQFNESCSGYSAAVTGMSAACSGSQSGTTFTISPPANNNSCFVWWTITAGSAAAGACTANIIGAGNTWYDTQGINVSVTVTATQSSPPGTTPDTNLGTTPNTTTPTSNLTITIFPTETRITQNASGNATISVKNTGLTTFAGIRVYVDGINQSWYTQPAAQDINSGIVKNYSIIFNIPASAPPLSYSIRYVANNSAASNSVSASLLVIPSNQTAAQIVSNISNYTQKYDQVSLLLNQTKARGANTTDAEAVLKQAQDLLNKANEYIKAGDYFSAYQLISQIDTLIKSTEAKITEASQNFDKSAGSMWLWIAVILAVGVVSVFIFYFALPPKKNGFASGTGYQYMLPGTKGKSRIILIKSKINLIKERLKKALEKIRQKFKRKQTAQPYSYKGNQSVLQPFIYKGPPLE